MVTHSFLGHEPQAEILALKPGGRLLTRTVRRATASAGAHRAKANVRGKVRGALNLSDPARRP